MAEHKIYLEESLVAPELRDRLFRADPRALNGELFGTEELADEYISVVEDAVTSIGVLTPVLLDNDANVVAGRGIVEAAIRIGLEDVPALRLEELCPSEWQVYTRSMARYLGLVDLDSNVFPIEARHILAMICTA